MSKVYDRYESGELTKTGVTLDNDLLGSDGFIYSPEEGGGEYRANGTDYILKETETFIYDRYELGTDERLYLDTKSAEVSLVGESLVDSIGIFYDPTTLVSRGGCFKLRKVEQAPSEPTVPVYACKDGTPLIVGEEYATNFSGGLGRVLGYIDRFVAVAYEVDDEGTRYNYSVQNHSDMLCKFAPETETLEQFCERESERVYGVHISNLDAEDAIALASKYLESRLPKSDS